MANTEPKTCLCPLRPYFSSWGSGSAQEVAALRQWDVEHGSHPYAKARDELARAMHSAEAQVGSGKAVMRMAYEIMGAAPVEKVAPPPEPA